MLNKKNMIITALIVACVIIVIPLIIDWLIIGNSVPSNIANSDWVSFLGGYIGAILGGIGSLLGIIWTIRFTAEQNRKDRELQIRPYFDIKCDYVKSFCHTKTWLGYVLIDTWDQGEEKNDSTSVRSCLIRLRNVGNGAATNLNFKISIHNENLKHESRFTNKNMMVTTNSISPNMQADLSIGISSRKQAPKKEDCQWENINGMSLCNYDHSKYSFPSNYSFSIEVLYSDLLGNRFSQMLRFDTSFYMKTPLNEDCSFACDINLKEIEPPKIINMSL